MQIIRDAQDGKVGWHMGVAGSAGPKVLLVARVDITLVQVGGPSVNVARILLTKSLNFASFAVCKFRDKLSCSIESRGSLSPPPGTSAARLYVVFTSISATVCEIVGAFRNDGLSCHIRTIAHRGSKALAPYVVRGPKKTCIN